MHSHQTKPRSTPASPTTGTHRPPPVLGPKTSPLPPFLNKAKVRTAPREHAPHPTMHPTHSTPPTVPHRTTGMHRPKMLLSAFALYGMLLVSTMVDAVVPCPALAVTAKAKPRAPRKPGSIFAVLAKVRNTGSTTLQNVSLVINVPISATYKGALAAPPVFKRFGASKAGPVVVGQSAYWPNFSLAPGKGLAVKLRGKVDKCEQTGTYNVQVAAYMTNPECSTPSGKPITVS